MSVIGPRPQLVRDLVFMSKEERKRHTVKPGLHLNGAGYKKLYDILDCALEECDGDEL